jgi:hypothetical protein
MAIGTRTAFAIVVAAGSASAERQPPVREFPATNDELFANRELLAEGTNVYLSDLVVRAKSGLVMRASYRHHDIFIVPVDPSVLDFLAIGARIDVRGTLRDAPSVGQARLVFAMSASEARRLSRQRVYVDAWSVNPS